MALIKAYARKSFILIGVTGLVLLSVTVAGIHVGWRMVQHEMFRQTAAGLPAGETVTLLAQLHDQYFWYVTGGLAAIFLILGLMLWLGLRRTVRRTLQATPAGRRSSPTRSVARSDAPAGDPPAAQRQRQRLFLHLLSVLQREGRLLDFLAENLDQYDDAQIGAAVRGVQAGCKKAVAKILKLEPVIDKPEGGATRLDPGFDPHAVTLIGNVSGEPPFTGVLRHRGWRTAKLDLPILSDVQDAGLIAPAEVEIV